MSSRTPSGSISTALETTVRPRKGRPTTRPRRVAGTRGATATTVRVNDVVVIESGSRGAGCADWRPLLWKCADDVSFSRNDFFSWRRRGGGARMGFLGKCAITAMNLYVVQLRLTRLTPFTITAPFSGFKAEGQVQCGGTKARGRSPHTPTLHARSTGTRRTSAHSRAYTDAIQRRR